MRFKTLFAVAAGLLFSGGAIAQDALPEAPTQTLAVTPALTPEDTLHLDLSTGGRVSIQLRPDAAPHHVERIKALARQGFYNGLTFHRVIEGFMAQTGDPTGTGAGGSQLPDLAAEFNTLPHVRGAVSAARAEAENSANSQFFIMFIPRLALDNDYTVFGRVVSGMQYVDAIQRGEPPANPSRIVRASIGADNVPALTAAELQAMAAQQAAAAAATLAPPAALPAAPQDAAPAASVEAAPAPQEAAPAAEAPAGEAVPAEESAEVQPEAADTPEQAEGAATPQL